MPAKRKTLKKTLLTKIIISVAVIIIIITQISIRLTVNHIQSLTDSILARESATYASEIYGWWSNIEQRVRQTADVIKTTPEMSYEDTLKMLLQLTESDPDSQDIYMAYGKESVFLDGSGWEPDEDFDFSDREWYKGALKNNGELFTSEPYVDASTGKTCLACSVMIEGKTVLSSDINFDIDQIYTESNNLRQETENITSISENLNRYSDEINSDLSQYTL